MGCDIHFYVERKVNGIWEQQFDPDVKNHGLHSKGKYWTHVRNYMLFGLLAGVRNHEVTPISVPRGVPEDLSESLKVEWENWIGDGHTPSYFLLKELLDAKESRVIYTGFVGIEQYKEFKINGRPQKWTWDPYLEKRISNEEMDRILKILPFLDEGEEYCSEIIWHHPYKEICPPFWEEDLEKISQLDSDSNNIRCVFWFDN